MAAKIISAAITLVLLAGLAIVVFAFMIIAMNGFSGSDAEWGIYAYIGSVLLVTALMSAGACVLTARLIRNARNAAFAVLISTAVFTAIGAILICVSGFAGIMAAEVVRRYF